MSPLKLLESTWLTGPSFLEDPSLQQNSQVVFSIQDYDPEVRKDATIYTTQVQEPRTLGSDRFKRFSTFGLLRRAVANLIVATKQFKRRNGKLNKGSPETEKSKGSNKLRAPTVEELQQATNVILLTIQEDAFQHELNVQHPKLNCAPSNGKAHPSHHCTHWIPSSTATASYASEVGFDVRR